MIRGEMGSFNTIRKVASAAVCVVALTCVLAHANPRQDSSGSGKKTTSTASSSKVHHSSSTATSSAKTTHTTSSSKKKSSKKKSSHARGQQKIDSGRAQAIQEALIREHYLNGEATGTWNESSEAAMRRYQADHGWQSKTVPDSRALISLGLGPSKDRLLNPESAMTTVPDAPKAEPMPTTSHTSPATAQPAAPSVPATSTSQSETPIPQ